MKRTIVCLLICCLLLCGCEAENGEVSEDVSAALEESEEQALLPGYGLYIDGELFVVSPDRETLRTLLDERLSTYLSAFPEENLLYGNFLSDVKIKETKCAFYSSEKELRRACGRVNCTAAVREYEHYAVPYGTLYIYEKRTTEDTLLKNGTDGVGTTEFRTLYEGGAVVSRVQKADYVSVLPDNEEVLTGDITKGTETMGTTESTLFTKPYDGRLSSTYGELSGRTHAHMGIDIIGFPGVDCKHEPALAAADGIVTVAGYNHGGYGNMVIIDHGNEVETVYGHFFKVLVEEGQFVTAGTPIGLIGTTGDSTGNHLHFEVRVKGRKINPLLFLEYHR